MLEDNRGETWNGGLDSVQENSGPLAKNCNALRRDGERLRTFLNEKSSMEEGRDLVYQQNKKHLGPHRRVPSNL